MTDGGVHTCYYFIKPLGSDQTEPLHLDFSYHLESLCAEPRRDQGALTGSVLLCSGRSRLRLSARQKRRPGRRRTSRPKVTAVVDVEIRLSVRWRALPPRHCNASHYAERRRDADPDSCRLSLLVCWQVPS